MRRHVDNLYQNVLGFNFVEHTVFLAQSRRSMPFPLPSERLIVEAANGPQSRGPGDTYDVLPLFVAFQYLNWQGFEFFGKAFVLEYLPHTEFSIYAILGMGKAPIAA